MASQYGEAYQKPSSMTVTTSDVAIHERMVALERSTFATTDPAAPDAELAPVIYVDCFGLHPKNLQEFNL